MNGFRYHDFGKTAQTPAEYHRYILIRQLHASGNMNNRWGSEERRFLREVGQLVKHRRYIRIRDSRRHKGFLDWVDRYTKPICWILIMWCVVLVAVAMP